jgi:hypothetical protein
MEGAQLLHSTGKAAVEKISCDHVNGQTIIYWEDIEQVFLGVKHVKDDATVKTLRDSNENSTASITIQASCWILRCRLLMGAVR